MTEDLLRYLSERKSALTSESIEELRTLLLTHNRIREYFEKLSKKGFIFFENVDTELPFDYWIRKDTLGLFVFIEKISNDIFVISKEKLQRIEKTIRQYPDFQGVMLVGFLDAKLQTVIITWNELVEYRKEDAPIQFQEFKSIKDSISGFFSILDLPVGKSLRKIDVSERRLTADLLLKIRSLLEEEFHNLESRPFRLNHKRKAVESISPSDIENLANFISSAISQDYTQSELIDLLDKVLRGEMHRD